MTGLFHISFLEMRRFFSSATGLVAISASLIAILLLFFWKEAFFARNIADLQPLFDWLPIIVMFYAAVITMRIWTEETTSGNLDRLLVMPLSSWWLISGKFGALKMQILLLLLLTLPLPLMLSTIAEIEWGLVITSYLGVLLFAYTTAAIGFLFSSLTSHQLVSLVLTLLLSGLFYLIGTDHFTALFPRETADHLRYFSTYHHLQALFRGVIDLSDITYFICLAMVFFLLTLLIFIRLPLQGIGVFHKGLQQLGVLALILVILLIYPWVTAHNKRWDLTDNKRYSISQITKDTLGQLEQPLEIYGYFSQRTHPLLNNLAPQLIGVLEEYRLAAPDKVKVQIIDPQHQPEEEAIAAKRFGLEPITFQIADRYQTSVSNTWFDIVIEYGGQFQHLGYRELIEAKITSETAVAVRLRNPEYDITRRVKQLKERYQNDQRSFDALSKTEPVEFKGFISTDEKLPVALQRLKQELKAQLQLLQMESFGRFTAEILDPESDDGAIADQIKTRYGFMPMIVEDMKTEPFWFYMLMKKGERTIPIALPEKLAVKDLREILVNGIKHFIPGALHQITLVAPPEPLSFAGFKQKGFATWKKIKEKIREVAAVSTSRLNTAIPLETDILMLIEPESITQEQLYNIDQYLMGGGSVVIASSPWKITLTQDSILATEQKTGLEDWLSHHGLKIDSSLVMSKQNIPFPVPTQRKISDDILIKEVQYLDYPYFLDLRAPELQTEKDVAATVDQMTINWVSPVLVETKPNLRLTELLHSPTDSWKTTKVQIQPDFMTYPDTGFMAQDKGDTFVLAAALEGRFQSWFKSAALTKTMTAHKTESGEDAKLVVIGSAIYLADSVNDLMSQAVGSTYRNSWHYMQNLIGWMLEDQQLNALRGRGNFARMLNPMTQRQQQRLEYTVYGSIITAIILIWICAWLWRRWRLTTMMHRIEQVLKQPQGPDD